MKEVQSSCQQLGYLCVLLLAGVGDLRDVRSAVANLAGTWQDLGISLGLDLSDLDAILSDNPHSSSDCLRETLKLWLRQSYEVIIGPALYTIPLLKAPLTLTLSVRFTEDLVAKGFGIRLEEPPTFTL